MRSDRNLDYHGYKIDGIAHYASGFRETRASLESIIETAKRNPDGTISYIAMVEDSSGIRKPVQKTMTQEMLAKFRKQYAAIPNPKDKWEQAKI